MLSRQRRRTLSLCRRGGRPESDTNCSCRRQTINGGQSQNQPGGLTAINRPLSVAIPMVRHARIAAGELPTSGGSDRAGHRETARLAANRVRQVETAAYARAGEELDKLDVDAIVGKAPGAKKAARKEKYPSGLQLWARRSSELVALRRLFSNHPDRTDPVKSGISRS